MSIVDAQTKVSSHVKRLEMLQNSPQTPNNEFASPSNALYVAHVCIGVFDPAGVLAPGVAESVPPVLFFFFFFLGIKAGGFDCAARSDK
jgi:hypothetical protein